MNEQLQTALAQIITKSLETADKAEAFILAEMPNVVQQLLTWKFWDSIVRCVGGLSCYVAGAGLVYLCYWLWKRSAEKDRYMSDVNSIPSTIGALIFLCCTWIPACFLVNLTWLQIWVAPKVYLIEYASSLIN